MNQKIVLAITSMAMILTGCVSTSTYKKSQAETAACLAEKESQRQTLTQQIDALNKEKSALSQSSADKDAELAKLKGTYDELVGNLKNEISSGQIQVTPRKAK